MCSLADSRTCWGGEYVCVNDLQWYTVDTYSSRAICPTATRMRVNRRNTVNMGRLREEWEGEGGREGERGERERERRGRERG